MKPINYKYLGISFIFAFLLSCFFKFNGVNQYLIQFENKTFDWRTQFRAHDHEIQENPIVIVGIDDISEEVFGRFPWSRDKHALFFQAISNYPPKGVGIDILFDQNVSGGEQFDQQMYQSANLLDDVSWAMFYRTDEDKIPFSLLKVSPSIDQLISMSLEFEGDDHLIPVAEQIHLPKIGLPPGHLVGAINTQKDIDGVVRQLNLIYKFNEHIYPSFMLSCLMAYLDIHPSQIKVKIGQYIEIKTQDQNIHIPINNKGEYLVNFRNQLKDFKNYNFVSILKEYSKFSKKMYYQSEILKDIENKLVLVGVTSTGSVDIYPTPISNASPLIVVHANAVLNILNQDYIKDLLWADQFYFVLIMTFIFLIVLLCLPPSFSLIIFILINGCYFYFSWKLFQWHNIWLSWVKPFLIVVSCFLLSSIIHYWNENRSKKWVQRALGKYVPENVQKWILSHPSELKLGGERKYLTVLFADIVGFTDFCESTKPEQVVPILNEYLNRMTNIIFKYNGTVDKYVGDAIIAIFGAPSNIDEESHAGDAVKAALEMVEAQAEYSKNYPSKKSFQIGIGINSGEMIVGNMGSQKLMNYTVIGDEVNIGARIEKLTRNYSTPILISNSCQKMLNDEYITEFVDEVQVKGREKKIKIFSVAYKR